MQKKNGFMKKYPRITIILFSILALVLLYFVKDIQGNLEKKAVIKVANSELTENNKESLKLLSKPLTWSIRSEMLRGNMEQVDILISDLVKENNFEFVHLVGVDGNISLSTNKKMIGKVVDLESVAAMLGADTTTMLQERDSTLIVVAPVMGYDSKLGTLVFGYKPRLPDYK
jgi:hypothetical protein